MSNQLTRGQELAAGVLMQLGGNQFLAMTGTKPKYYDEKKMVVMFELRRNKIGAKYMQVHLNGMDTYDVTFFKMKNKTSIDRIILQEKLGMYDDMLRPMFTNVTGLYTRL